MASYTRKEEIHVKEPVVTKVKEEQKIVKEGVVYPDGTVHDRKTTVDTDIKRGNITEGEEFKDKVKDAGRSVGDAIKDGAKKIGLITTD